jgi:hypothetical protein
VAIDPHLTDHDIAIRGSMLKFECEHRHFEVCSYAKPMILYLNRQAIMLLEYRGIKKQVRTYLWKLLLIFKKALLDRQAQVVGPLKKMIKCRKTAIKVLKRQSKQYKTCRKALQAGFEPNEPFINNMLLCLRYRVLRDLQSKARFVKSSIHCVKAL